MMVCTRGREALLEQWLRSVREMTVPPGVKVHIVVADNNDVCMQREIQEAADQHGLDIVYAYEPSRGYSTARNAAVEAALATDAQLLIFTDDDLTVERDLLVAYLSCFKQFEADVVHGARTSTRTIGREGRRISSAQTYNVAFRRWLVDNDGMQLRFSLWLNLLGSEDIDFFSRAITRGAIIRRSIRPRVAAGRPPPNDAANANPDAYFIANGRNAIYIARARGGLRAALGVCFAYYLRRGPQGLSGRLGAWLFKPLMPRLSGRFARESKRDLALFKGAMQGFVLPPLDRALAKDGKLVVIEEPGETGG